MKTKLGDSFVLKLNDQVKYIALDKPIAARKFKNNILELVRNIKDAPLANRKSIYFDDLSIREFTFKAIRSFTK